MWGLLGLPRDNPMYKDEFNVAQFLDRADIMIGQALLLRYKPVNLDVLPLYIVLVLAAPAVLWACCVGRTGRCSALRFSTSQLDISIGTCLRFQAANGISIPSPGSSCSSSAFGVALVAVPQ
jgi:OpgC protein